MVFPRLTAAAAVFRIVLELLGDWLEMLHLGLADAADDAPADDAPIGGRDGCGCCSAAADAHVGTEVGAAVGTHADLSERAPKPNEAERGPGVAVAAAAAGAATGFGGSGSGCRGSSAKRTYELQPMARPRVPGKRRLNGSEANDEAQAGLWAGPGVAVGGEGAGSGSGCRGSSVSRSYGMEPMARPRVPGSRRLKGSKSSLHLALRLIGQDGQLHHERKAFSHVLKRASSWRNAQGRKYARVVT